MSTLILGGSGRIGEYLRYDLSEYDDAVIAPSHRECNLLDGYYTYEKWWAEYQPELVINLAGKKTNIQLNQDNPASIFRDTMQMNLAVLDMCKKWKVDKLVNVICSCSYPDGKELLREEEFLDGNPHKSVAPHGYAKRMVYLAGQFYRAEHKKNVVTLALNNVFGSGSPRAWDKPASLKFLDSIIKKIVDAKMQKLKTISLWGTGIARRECIYYKDAAKYVSKVASGYNEPELINVGTGIDYTIAEWAEIVSKVVAWNGRVEYNGDKSKDGQLRKLFDVSKMRDKIGYAFTPIEDAIDKVVDSYMNYIKLLRTQSVVGLS